MKKFLLGSVGLAAMLAGPAMAADMRVAPPAPPPVVYYDWSGAYIGGNVGGVWYDITRSYTGAPPFVGPAFNQTTTDSDGIFGFHAGAQVQYGAWVWGVEAALSACFDECRSFTGVLPTPPFTANLTHEHKMTNLFTVGPRLGYAWDRWMWFVTGGGASATLKGQTCSNVTGLCGVTSSNGQTRDQWGWYVGTGFDYMARARWSTCSSASSINTTTSATTTPSAAICAATWRAPDRTTSAPRATWCALGSPSRLRATASCGPGPAEPIQPSTIKAPGHRPGAFSLRPERRSGAITPCAASAPAHRSANR
jgi:outer membrane immunogenic protein